MPQHHQIAVQSTAMFSTWVAFPADQICFDMGDGLAARLRHKLIRLNTIAISHSHRDHVAGLFMYLNIRTNHPGPIQIVYPRDSRLMQQIQDFLPAFERKVPNCVDFIPVGPGDVVPLTKPKLFMRTFQTNHYKIRDNAIRSLGYHLFETKKKVRVEFRHLSQSDTFGLIKEKGRDHVLEDIEETYLTYSGDTTALNPDEVRGTPLLFHEATFINKDDRQSDEGEARYHLHSTLDEAMQTAVEGEVGHLVLYHFSSRYNSGEVMDAVKKSIRRFKPNFPVSIAMPSVFAEDILMYNVNNSANVNDAPSPELKAQAAQEQKEESSREPSSTSEVEKSTESDKPENARAESPNPMRRKVKALQRKTS
jgi:ribonuclease Z